jgi:4-hydroxyphenylacetate 3-monooxygenase
MLMTGKEYLSSIRDGRRVYIGGELVEDVTAHPAFRNAAQSFAMIYDRKRDPENRDLMTFEEDGETFSTYFLLPRTREDLQRRFETHRRIASWTHGLLGRSPDNFPSYVSGLVMDPAMFDSIRQGFGTNIRNFYQHMRGNEASLNHAREIAVRDELDAIGHYIQEAQGYLAQIRVLHEEALVEFSRAQGE